MSVRGGSKNDLQNIEARFNTTICVGSSQHMQPKYHLLICFNTTICVGSRLLLCCYAFAYTSVSIQLFVSVREFTDNWYHSSYGVSIQLFVSVRVEPLDISSKCLARFNTTICVGSSFLRSGSGIDFSMFQYNYLCRFELIECRE